MLQEALVSEDEAAICEAMRRFEELGLEDPVTVAKVKAKQQLWEVTRQRLHKAMETKSATRINRAIGDFQSRRLQDTGELQPAVDRLLSLEKRGKFWFFVFLLL